MKNDNAESEMKFKKEQFLNGIGVSSEIAIGTAHVIQSGLGQLPEYKIVENNIKNEKRRFRTAVSRAQKQITRLKAKTNKLSDATADELRLLLDAHAAMLTSKRMVIGIETVIEERRINAESAVQTVVHEIAKGFTQVKDPFLSARLQDINDVGSRILRQLMQTPYQAFSQIPEGSVLIAEELSPADTALIDPLKIAGFVTQQGGSESHTAIMARSMNLPAILGTQNLLTTIRSGQTLVVDGENGKIILDPTPETLNEYRRKIEARRRLNRQLARLRSLPALTQDKTRVSMQANIELARDIDGALNAGAEGIGLLRTEFMFLNRNSLPNEEEQYTLLKAIVEGMQGRPVTIRTFDLGGDKLPTLLDRKYSMSANPMLGLRAVRLSIKEQKLFEVQLTAILRASEYGPLKILLPMISSVEQIRQVKQILNRVIIKLKKRNPSLNLAMPPLGAMIEIPAAALIADSLAREVDFFAIGTNDLTMYTLAIDRGDEQVANLFNPLHPAVLRLIQFTLEAARRNNKPASVCGEIAGDPRFAPLLIGLGVRELSMAWQSIPRVKQRIRVLKTGPATRRAFAILDQTDEDKVAVLLDDFNEDL